MVVMIVTSPTVATRELVRERVDDGFHEIDGGIGDDTIATKDGFVDNVNCGLGKDKLTRDGNDTVKRCE